MTSKTLKSAIWLTLIASAMTFVAGPSVGKGAPPGKGNKPPSEATNNLSVPAIMAGRLGAFTGLVCPTNGPSGGFSDLTLPDKDPVYYPESCATSKDGTYSCVEDGNYYVQRNAKWQAPCFLSESIPVDVLGRWGDNLAGDAMLKVGSPIRVELVLFDGASVADGQQGYFVIKLEPTELDRVSDYGHLAAGSGTETDPFLTIPYTVGDDLPGGGTFGAIVHDPDARLKIERIVDGDPVSTVYDNAAGGEINATGKIVYGYGLRVETAGTYRITYTFDNVNFASDDEAVPVCDAGSCIGNEAILEIVVTGGGGGKKGGN